MRLARSGRRHTQVCSGCESALPVEMEGCDQSLREGAVVVQHRVGYLHQIADTMSTSKLTRALYIALHGGLGLEHPELTNSWPPTLQILRNAAPVSLAVSSFNPIEHDAAKSLLQRFCSTQLIVDAGGVNRAGSLHGPDTIGPFDGMQGKRNYCLLYSRIVPLERSEDGWDLFE